MLFEKLKKISVRDRAILSFAAAFLLVVIVVAILGCTGFISAVKSVGIAVFAGLLIGAVAAIACLITQSPKNK